MYKSDNNDGTFTNPIIFADYPDPDIICVDDDFFMVSSSFVSMPGIPICHSKDLINWKIIGYVYDSLDYNDAYSMKNGETRYGMGSWAPCIRYNRGKFYICFNTNDNGFVMCIAHDIKGPYQMNFFGCRMHDPGLFFDDDNRVYVVHGCNKLYVTELDLDAKKIVKDEVFIYESEYGGPFEGSHVYKKNGYYYICNTSRGYKGIEVCLRSKNIYGPYESKLILDDDMNYPGAGLHQGGFIDLKSNETWFFLFQDRDYLGRVPVLQRVNWIEDWPIIGDINNNFKAAVTYKKPNIKSEAFIHKTEFSDDFNEEKLGMQWQWNHNPDNNMWSLIEKKGYLRIKSSYAKDFLHARNTLTQRLIGPNCTGSIKVNCENMKSNDIGGLGIVGMPYAYIAIEAFDNCKRIIMVNNDQIVNKTDIFNNSIVYFKIISKGDSKAYFYYSFDNNSFILFGNELDMKFTTKTFQGNKFGLFNYNTSGFGGYLDFDWFELE